MSKKDPPLPQWLQDGIDSGRIPVFNNDNLPADASDEEILNDFFRQYAAYLDADRVADDVTQQLMTRLRKPRD